MRWRLRPSSTAALRLRFQPRAIWCSWPSTPSVPTAAPPPCCLWSKPAAGWLRSLSSRCLCLFPMQPLLGLLLLELAPRQRKLLVCRAPAAQLRAGDGRFGTQTLACGVPGKGGPGGSPGRGLWAAQAKPGSRGVALVYPQCSSWFRT